MPPPFKERRTRYGAALSKNCNTATEPTTPSHSGQNAMLRLALEQQGCWGIGYQPCVARAELIYEALERMTPFFVEGTTGSDPRKWSEKNTQQNWSVSVGGKGLQKYTSAQGCVQAKPQNLPAAIECARRPCVTIPVSVASGMLVNRCPGSKLNGASA